MQIMSVSGFLAYVNETFKAIWDAQEVAIEGEVFGYRLSQGQWVSFDLKDADGLVNIFLPVWKMQGPPIEDGMRVRVFGLPRVYPKYGKFSLSAERIEIAGEGGLRKALALLRQRLEQEGLFDSSRKRQLPRFPMRIALIASRESAAYGDFIRILNERWRGLEIDLYHVLVQGENAPGQIVRAIEWAGRGVIDHALVPDPMVAGPKGPGRNELRPYDALVLTRGGGSLEELMAFNDERVVRALYGSKIPTLVGIGHERDLTFAEEVADVRASTPTDCARRLVSDRQDVLYELATLERGISEALEFRVDQWRETIANSIDVALRWIKGLEDRRASLTRLFQSFDPRSVVQRGYAIISDGTGQVRTALKGLRPQDTLTIAMRDGTAETLIQSLYAKKEK
ncbi:exodeoxyribonuclease VII large subunit [Candidatus Uhrbacteria bacterium]|nr:exodeoxyribonuclease VII large subunit [Candidatus Uhrbacteria bacterium]